MEKWWDEGMEGWKFKAHTGHNFQNILTSVITNILNTEIKNYEL